MFGPRFESDISRNYKHYRLSHLAQWKIGKHLSEFMLLLFSTRRVFSHRSENLRYQKISYAFLSSIRATCFILPILLIKRHSWELTKQFGVRYMGAIRPGRDFLTLQSHSNYSLLRQNEIKKRRVCLEGRGGQGLYNFYLMQLIKQRGTCTNHKGYTKQWQTSVNSKEHIMTSESHSLCGVSSIYTT